MKKPIRSAAFTVALVVASAGTAHAATRGVHCGSVVKHSVKLRHDLTCHGDALTVGANGVVLDLAGHTLKSTTGGGTGIAVQGHRNVTILHGALSGFTNAVDLENSHRVLVKRLRLRGNDDNGVLVFDSDRVRITDSSSAGASNGFFFGRTTKSRIDHDHASGRNAGVLLFISSASKVDHNSLSDLPTDGIDVSGARNTLSHNTITGARNFAVNLSSFHDDATGQVTLSPGNRVLHNRLQNVATGMAIYESDSATVRGNTISGARDGG